MTPEAAFGSVIRQTRRWREMKQDELAHKSGIGRTFLSKLERGLSQPTLTTILQLATALRLEPGELITRVVSLMEKDENQEDLPTQE